MSAPRVVSTPAADRTAKTVLVAGMWDEGAGYPRTTGLIDAMVRCGFEVERVRVDPPRLPGGSKARLLRSPWAWPRYLFEQRRASRALRLHLQDALTEFGDRVACVVVPYPGHRVVHPVCEVVGGKVPVVLDLFLSAYGTVIEDRRMFGEGSWVARFMDRLDRHAVDAADLALMDTPQHAAYVSERTRTHTRVDWVPITDLEDTVLMPADETESRSPCLDVLFFGTGVALHGLPVLCEAVASCREPVRLTLVGGSPKERDHAQAIVPAERLVLGEVFEPKEVLRRRIQHADLVAGVFGASRKAQLVVPYKVVHALAAGRPVLTGDTAALRALVDVGRDCAVCAVADPEALAEALDTLARDPGKRDELRRAARPAFDRAFSPVACAQRMAAALASIGIEVPLCASHSGLSSPGSEEPVWERVETLQAAEGER